MNPTNLQSGPVVSIIIPARNEEANLERCLRSLVVQQGVPFDIFVVDDGSTDRTREIAESFTRVKQCPFIGANTFLTDVQVVSARTPLPPGWTGKANALHTAEQLAQGQWLLFTDADTEHAEGSLAAALREAEEHRAEMLSYSPEQELQGWRQRAVMPIIFSELAHQYRPRLVSDPNTPDAAANGQYILVRAETHRRLGGFASVAGELLDDVALARRYKQNGARIRFRLGKGLVRTRMYRSWEDLRAGWTKNLALLFPKPEQLATKASATFWAILVLAVATLIAFSFKSPVAWVGLAATVAAISWFYARVAKAHFSLGTTLCSFFGLPLFARLLRDSARAHRQGRVVWSGRTYGAQGIASDGAASNPKLVDLAREQTK